MASAGKSPKLKAAGAEDRARADLDSRLDHLTKGVTARSSDPFHLLP